MDADSTRAPIGATPLTTSPDADILAAWDRILANNRALDELGGTDEAKEWELWGLIRQDEIIIQSTVAMAPAGAEVQAWCYLMHSVPSAEDERAVLRRDLPYFMEREAGYDWTERLIFSAIRSLQAQASRAGATCSPSPFADAMQAYRDANNMAIGFHLLNNPGEGVGTDEQWSAFETAFDGYVEKARAAALAALLTPAATAGDMVGKQHILDEQEGFAWNDGEVEAYTRQLIADAVKLAGGVA